MIQINQNEITNLKQDLACTEEKMVYQSYERTRDIWVRSPIYKSPECIRGTIMRIREEDSGVSCMAFLVTKYRVRAKENYGILCDGIGYNNQP